MLFRYFGCPSDAFSHSIEAMRMLPDAAPIHSMLHERGRRRGPSLRAALQLPGPAEAIAHEVPDQLVAWGLPRNGHVPVLHVPQVLLELVLRHSWHSLMWRSTRAGGMLLQPVLDFPLLIGRTPSSGLPSSPRLPRMRLQMWPQSFGTMSTGGSCIGALPWPKEGCR